MFKKTATLIFGHIFCRTLLQQINI